MDLIAIDIGTEFVSLGKWDGRRAIALRRPLCFPGDAWGEWMQQLQAGDRHEAAFRIIHPEWSLRCSREAVEPWARTAGCHWLRFLNHTAACDAGLAAARYLANRTRWTQVLSVEVSGSVVRSASQDRRGNIDAFAERRLTPGSKPDAKFLTELAMGLSKSIHATDDSNTGGLDSADQRFGLICLGDAADEWGPGLAMEAGIANVLVPNHAESWPILGMMIAPIVQTFARNQGSATLSATEIRRLFADMMDEACDSVTHEGYDLDDAETRRTVVFSPREGSRLVEIDMETLLEPARRTREWTREMQEGLVDDSTAAEVRFRHVVALHSRVTIFPPTPNWPIEVAPPLTCGPR